MVESGRAEVVSAGATPDVMRRTPRPYVFRELSDVAPGAVPVEYDGFGPLDGDIVERFGRTVVCRVLTGEQCRRLRPWIADFDHLYDEGGFVSIDAESGKALLWGLNHGTIAQVIYGAVDLKTGELHTGTLSFEHEDQRYWWSMEHVRCIDAAGVDYDWRAPVALTTEQSSDPRTPLTHWSPEFARRSESHQRVSRSLGQHRRRVRLADATVERVDPMEVFIRDAWVCGICQKDIDQGCKWPDPMSASLDHVIALANNGDHSLLNVQAAHLVCNLRKGAREPADFAQPGDRSEQ
jgi:5-methylcytosine-specific restriction endonuclease McrA